MSIAASSHGGDAGGDPPAPNWQPPFGCQSSGSRRYRGTAQNYELDEKREDNEGPLPIQFDTTDLKTYNPVGSNAKHFKSLLGVLVRRVPLFHDSWRVVPNDHKGHVWPTIEWYFDMNEWIHNREESDTVRRGVIFGVESSCTKIYRNAKAYFKEQHFTKRGGADAESQIRAEPPRSMPEDMWNRYVDSYMRESALNRSAKNKDNRSKQPYIGTQGRKSFAEIRYEEYEAGQEYPSVINTFENIYTRKGNFVAPVAEQRHVSISSENDSIGGDDFVMRTSEFVTNQVFGSREKLVDWVQKLAYSLGVVVVTKRSNKRPCGFVYRVVLKCQRGALARIHDLCLFFHL